MVKDDKKEQQKTKNGEITTWKYSPILPVKAKRFNFFARLSIPVSSNYMKVQLTLILLKKCSRIGT
jgi:hypothetical protein